MSLSRAMEATSPPEAAAWQEASDSDDSDVWTPYDSDAEDNVGEDLALASDETSAAPALVSNDSVSRTEMDVALILSDQEHYEHRLLKTEYVDFLSDFGRSEPFLVDGDALVLHALHDSLLDWQNGGQFLHLVFLVETFLRNLCGRGSKFDVFFFDSNKALFRQHSASFALARTAVLYHVKSHESKLPFKVHIIEGSWVNVPNALGSWRELIDTLRPTFVMSNAGHESGNLSILAVAQMAFVHNHLVAGHNVVKFDNLTFDGSRVWAFLYNLPDVAGSRVLRDFYDRLRAHGFADLFETQNEGGEGTQMCPDSSDLRTRLYLSSLSRVLDVCGQNPRARGLAMICLGCLEMMQVLPLDCRAFVLPPPAEKEDSSSSSVSSMLSVLGQGPRSLAITVAEFQDHLFAALTSSIHQLHQDICHDSDSDAVVADIFDGRLFTIVLLKLMAGHTLSGCLSETCVQSFTAEDKSDIKLGSSNHVLFSHPSSGKRVADCWWSSASSLLSATPDEAAWAKTVLEEVARLRDTKKTIQMAELQPVGHLENDMLSQVLGDVNDRMRQFEIDFQDGIGTSLGPFTPHHYHSTKPLDDEPDSFSYPFDKKDFSRKVPGEMSVEEYVSDCSSRYPHSFISHTLLEKLQDVEKARSEFFLNSGSFTKLMGHHFEGYMKGFISEKDLISEIKRALQRGKSKQAQFRLQQDQKRARYEHGYTQSLLAGSPVKEMTITERRSDEDWSRMKVAAASRLSSGSSFLDSTDGGSRHPQNQNSEAEYLERVNALQACGEETKTLEEKICKKENKAQKSVKPRDVDALARLRGEYEQCKATSEERLQGLSNLLRKEQDKKIVDCFRKEGKWTGRGEDAGFAATPNWRVVMSKLERVCKDKSSKSRKGEIQQRNVEAQEKKRLSDDQARFDNLKKTYGGEEPDRYLFKIEEFAASQETSPKIALMAWIHALEYAETKTVGEKKMQYIFLTTQRVLRHHYTILQSSDRVQIGQILGRLGFHDLANKLCDGLSKLEQSKIRSQFHFDSSSEARSSVCSIRFQLEVVPEHLARPKGKEDTRVQFPPDAWQQHLLDVVDSDNSALVVAPTASGKTFISYYVMEQCLRSNDTDVVVYVAPTKALVNQVRAEISARFSKNYSSSHKIVGVFTRDFRDDDFLQAQILVTVPACLGILLLTGKNVEWANRIRHIIFDEVHCIGQHDGEIWEQLLLMMEPNKGFLALSATLGNVDHFYNWLKTVEERRGRTVYKVVHHERWNDLYPWVWGEQKGTFESLNPCWVLKKMQTLKYQIDHASFPKDLKLLPEHCILLRDSMLEFVDDSSKDDLDVAKYFARVRPDDALWNLSMRDICAWEAHLKSVLVNLRPENQKIVLGNLSKQTQLCFMKSDESLGKIGEFRYVNQEIVPLIKDLKRRNMLPAICFMLNRKGCERLAQIVSCDFQDSEQKKRGPASAWRSKCLRKQQQLQDLKKRLQTCKAKVLVDSTGEVVADDRADLRKLIDQTVRELRELIAPDHAFCVNRVSEEDIENAFGSLPVGKVWQDYAPRAVCSALKRGIAVHHSGLNLKFRQAIERLFRAKKLGVIFATSTLAMGINMPSKTSVFVGDAVYLNAMNFRQMAGRAGRRGFDLRGNVVFMGCKSDKVFRLLRSDLPMLQGNLTLDNSLVLRLMIRQYGLRKFETEHNTKGEVVQKGIRSCVNLINFPLFNPFADTGSAQNLIGKQMAHCFRFSVEYLLSVGLLQYDEEKSVLDPNDLAAFVAHLFFTEPSNFAFLTLLLSDGGNALRMLCQPGKPERAERVVSILCHLFCRCRLDRPTASWAEQRPDETGPSTVVLKKLSEIGVVIEDENGCRMREGEYIQSILRKHNAHALKALAAYTACFVKAYPELGADNILPLSQCCVPASQPDRANWADLDESMRRLRLPNVLVRSAFVALSGHHDEFSSIQELSNSSRRGVFLDPKMVPIFDLYDESIRLNAYCLDFFKHGQKKALVTYNRRNEDSVWEDLQSFSLVLKALTAAMKRRHEVAKKHGRSTLFDDPDVLDTFQSITAQFSEKMRKAAA